MLVFGDASRRLAPRAELSRLQLAVGTAGGTGIEAHARVVSLFIDAAELAQGLCDADFVESGCDRGTPAGIAAMGLVMAHGAALRRSWDEGEAAIDLKVWDAIRRLQALDLPESVVAKEAEGYAFYALYPEAYVVAAKALRELSGARVIGIRSIGLGLAALVACTANAAAPLSVRPVGHPFERSLSLEPGLDGWFSSSSSDYAVVDEGPGLSGSSFGAVLDRLERNGVDPRRIHLFPSHDGPPGHRASEAQRQRWGRLSRHVVGFERLLLQTGERRHRLTEWVSDIAGIPLGPPRDLSGGAWRALRYPSEADWPAANPQSERRKYLVATPSGEWLLKFAGLGRYGTRKLPRAKVLAEAGFTSPIAGLRHGFTVERWHGDSPPLRPEAFGRQRLLARIADYLALRARAFPSPEAHGASLTDLAGMLAHNAREGIGWPGDFADLRPRAEALQARVRKVATDNRLHPHEWLELAGGHLVKTDALDHCEAHDLVGCQDIAWDVVGAAVEFGLDPAETEELARRVELGSGAAVDRDLLRFLLPCYLAFQLGAAAMARDSLGWAPREAARFDGETRRYGAALAWALQSLD